MVELEEQARALLSRRLSLCSNAPKQVVNRFAVDDSINVAGPILQNSERVDPSALIETATTKGQDHLLAIARRQRVDRPVTDILVRRGDRTVVVALVQNNGAEISEFGFLHLLRRSMNDSIVAENLGLRTDIPRHVFQQLIAKASEQVRRKLVSERTDLAPHIDSAVIDATGRLHAKFGPASSEYFQAKRTIRSLREQGRLKEEQIHSFAQQRKIYETTVALATLCDLPANLVERALLTDTHELTLVLAKALDLSWQTAMALLFLSTPEQRIYASQLAKLETEYSLLNVENSREVLAVYRARKEDYEQ
uniref:DUF2336 domain-containing protein n=1 Tax=Rhodopseudomonas palustris (strain BisA53) TaxID=316055 RepID=Q07SK9_RHOP5